MHFDKRPATFAVGEIFAAKLPGWFFLARVVRHEGERAIVVSLPEGGGRESVFQRKPSGATRAVATAEEARYLIDLLGTPHPDVADRKTRFTQLQAAKKSMNPFDKAEALGMLARRRVEPGLNSDDKVLYRQLRIDLGLELGASLGQSPEQIEALLITAGVPTV
jgi:RNA polymerase-interacting CarD/CdnL/TRCF family regulator